MEDRGGPGLSPGTTDDNHARILSIARAEVEKFHQIREQNKGKDVPDAIDSFNFGDMGISSLPEELADIIKDEAQRLALDRNLLTSLSGLSVRIGQFSKLKYLVARHNMLNEFPHALLSVNTLEFLDLRNNQLEALPEDLSRLSNLKVFSVRDNNVKRIPFCIAQMHGLQSLMTKRNPIEFPPKDEWKPNGRSSAHDDRELAETKEVKRVLLEYARRTRSRTPGGREDASEPSAETPKPIRRPTGGRFPIRPSVSNVDINASMTPISPAPRVAPAAASAKPFTRFPPTPGTAAMRPSLNPLSSGNERSRSSSESQMSTSRRKKRMGMQMSRGSKGSDQSELENLAAEANRLSHIRGVSHGLRLETSEAANGLTISSRPGSPVTSKSLNSSGMRTERQFAGSYAQLASLKCKPRFKDPLVDLADSILFSFDQYQPHYKYAVEILRNANHLLESLDNACRNARSAAEQLQHALFTLGHVQDDSSFIVPALRKSTVMGLRQPLLDADRAFDHVGRLLSAEVDAFVKHADIRRVRTFMLGIHAGNVEKSNAWNRFYNRTGILGHQLSQGLESYREIFPQQDYEQLYGRLQDDIENLVSASSRPRTSLRIPHEADVSRTLGPVDVNLPSQALPNGYSTEEKGGFAANGINHDFNGFNHEVQWQAPDYPLTAFMQPPNPDNSEDEHLFDTICRILHHACDDLLEALPYCKDYYARLHERVRDPQGVDPEIFHRLNSKRRSAHAAARHLKHRLNAVDIRDAVFRDDPDLWQHVFQFFARFRSFGSHIRKNSQKDPGIGFAPPGICNALKPVSNAIHQLEQTIKASPWSNYDQFSLNSEDYLPLRIMRPRPIQSPPNLGIQTNGTAARTDSQDASSATTTHSFASSGFVTPLPATPVSAALGSAAQSTISGGSQPSVGINSSVDRSRSVSSRR